MGNFEYWEYVFLYVENLLSVSYNPEGVIKVIDKPYYPTYNNVSKKAHKNTEKYLEANIWT